MSQDFSDPEIFTEFIVEAKEHLETIEPNLLELEKSPESLQLLNDIFRPMHSLKGASGFLGLNKINGLAHKAENILDELRKGAMRVTSEIMDVILAATDNLRVMIDSLEASGAEGDLDTGPTIARIEAILAGAGEAEAAARELTAAVERVAKAAPAPTGRIEEQLYDFSIPGEEKSESAGKGGAGRSSAAVPIVEAGPPYMLTAIGEGHLADFLEEAREIIENLNASLLELEKDPAKSELINDIFRYFHNLKGNSGIIGFKELNALTHEGETLLNKVRKGEMTSSHALIDLLLAVVDLIEEMIGRVRPGGEVAPLDASLLVERLQRVSEDECALASFSQAESEGSGACAPAAVEPVVEPAAEPAADDEDLEIFEMTVRQQIEHVDLALSELRKDAGQKEFVDALFRSLATIQNSSGYMGFDEIKVQAERTAGLVDQARKTDLDFGLMVDILGMECGILSDLIGKRLQSVAKGAPDQSAPASNASAEDASAKPAPTPAAPSKAVAAAAPVSSVAPVVPAAQVAPSKPAPAKAAALPPAPVEPVSPAAQAGAPVPAGQAGQVAQKAKSSSTIRVDHEKLDHLMNLIGELIINRNRYSMIARSLEEEQTDMQTVAQQLTETTYAMARISDDLQDTIMKVRMVPVSSVFSRFPRLVRDLSRKSGKQVELITEGEETELDKSVVEVIGDPLVHLIRNSVDHGLESEEERVAAGKSPVGRVWLRAYHKGNSVAIEVEDDGRGIDPEKIRQVAVKKGVITPDEARLLDDRAAIDLIFAPGFSSAEKVTDISGRGVGMDVVRNNIKELKGNINVSTEVGKGSKFTLSLPLTLAIIDALMVKVAGATYAIPLDAVSETTKLDAHKLTDINNRKAVTLRGEVLGIVELAELLELPRSGEEPPIVQLVVIHDNERRLGVVVDKLLERQEIVIKPLGSYLSEFDLKGISGATIMGDGSVVLILDPHEIYNMAVAR